jgi:hypothetical protein
VVPRASRDESSDLLCPARESTGAAYLFV